MANEFITRSGIRPDETEKSFTISTSDVQSYLQKKLDVTIASMVSNGVKQEPVSLRVYTTNAGRNFYPFAVVLPLSVLENSDEKKNDNENELEIFRPDNSDTHCRIKKAIFDMFSDYAYDKEDGNAFTTTLWRNVSRVSAEGAAYLRSLRLPRIVSYNNGNQKVVTFIIDPMRVFYDMVVNINSYANNFTIEIKSIKEIKTGEHRYHFKRVLESGKNGKNKNKKFKDTYILELNHKMRGSRR